MNPVGPLDAEEWAKTVWLYVFKIAFTASLLLSIEQSVVAKYLGEYTFYRLSDVRTELFYLGFRQRQYIEYRECDRSPSVFAGGHFWTNRSELSAPPGKWGGRPQVLELATRHRATLFGFHTRLLCNLPTWDISYRDWLSFQLFVELLSFAPAKSIWNMGFCWSCYTINLSDPGEASGCSTNTILSLTRLVSESPFPSPAFTALPRPNGYKLCFQS